MPPRVLPHRKWFLPDAYHGWRFRRAVHRAADEAPDVLHVSDGDLDGAGCDVMLRLHHGDDAVGTFFTSPYQLMEVLEIVAGIPGRGRTLAVSDLSPSKDGDALVAVVQEAADRGWTVRWRDHHHKQWEPDVTDALEAQGVDLRVDDAGTRCTADLWQEDLVPDDAFAGELAAVVRDHDLWLREDPRSEVLNDACYEMGARDLVQRLLETRDLEDPRYEEVHEEAELQRDRDASWGRERAVFHPGSEALVGVTYGSGPTNETLHRMMEEDGAHLAIMLRPEGSFSLRSRDEVEVCHVIAQAHDGGGHPNASGGKLDLPWWEMPRWWLQQMDHPQARALAREAVDVVDRFLTGEDVEPGPDRD